MSRRPGPATAKLRDLIARGYMSPRQGLPDDVVTDALDEQAAEIERLRDPLYTLHVAAELARLHAIDTSSFDRMTSGAKAIRNAAVDRLIAALRDPRHALNADEPADPCPGDNPADHRMGHDPPTADEVEEGEKPDCGRCGGSGLNRKHDADPPCPRCAGTGKAP
jgi:hypothetical protein